MYDQTLLGVIALLPRLHHRHRHRMILLLSTAAAAGYTIGVVAGRDPPIIHQKRWFLA